MKKLLSPVHVVLGYIFATILLLGISSFVLMRRVPEVNQGVVNRLVPLYKTAPVTQTITPVHDGLNVVVIFLKNRSILNNDKLVFTLSQNNQTVRTIELSGSNVGDGETVRFQFEPIIDSGSKTYEIKLVAPDTQEPKTPIEIGFSNLDEYKFGSASQVGDMSFQLFYKPVNKPVLIAELQAVFLSRLNPLFVISLGLSFIGCLWLAKLLK